MLILLFICYLINIKNFAGIAQLVEQLICNQQVAGSSPIASSKIKALNENLGLICFK